MLRGPSFSSPVPTMSCRLGSVSCTLRYVSRTSGESLSPFVLTPFVVYLTVGVAGRKRAVVGVKEYLDEGEQRGGGGGEGGRHAGRQPTPSALSVESDSDDAGPVSRTSSVSWLPWSRK